MLKNDNWIAYSIYLHFDKKYYDNISYNLISIIEKFETKEKKPMYKNLIVSIQKTSILVYNF